MFAKPVVFDSVMFGARGHPTRLESSKCEGTDIVLMNLHMMMGLSIPSETNRRTKFINQVKERKKISA